MPNPVFVGDTLSAETEVLETRESRPTPTPDHRASPAGSTRSARSSSTSAAAWMVYERTAPQAERSFPGTDEEWTV